MPLKSPSLDPPVTPAALSMACEHRLTCDCSGLQIHSRLGTKLNKADHSFTASVTVHGSRITHGQL